MREHFIVPSIGSQEITLAKRSAIWHCEHALQPFDLGNALFSVHPSHHPARTGNASNGRGIGLQRLRQEFLLLTDAE
jgi:hypothetical protein